jgi:uncharacterized SAM-binding protein YcdF (DUF218 family)
MLTTDTAMAASLDAIVVLGCEIHRSGRPAGAALRRAQRAAQAFLAGLAPRVVAAGGRVWGGVPEYRALSDVLEAAGVPKACILEEWWSLSTWENAHHTARLLRAAGGTRVGLVTCDWHMPRALRHFEIAGMKPVPIPVASPSLTPLGRRYRVLRERLSAAVGPTLSVFTWPGP